MISFSPQRAFPPALLVHFEQDEVGEASFAQAPGGAQAGDAAADDDDGDFLDAFWSREACAIAQEMSGLE